MLIFAVFAKNYQGSYYGNSIAINKAIDSEILTSWETVVLALQQHNLVQLW
jgi:hypothetical protein